MLALAAPPAHAAESAAKRTRVVLLPLQSYALEAKDLDTVSRALVERFRDDPEIELVDPVPVLSDKASAEWLRADSLLYDGIQNYQNLELVKAVEQLATAAEVMEGTFREFADVQGRRRMRDAYLHLGLARLEQGEQKEAEDGFAKAARVDPGFEPDSKTYPPAVRARFAEAKNERTDAVFEAGRERLRELGRLVDVDVVVAGGVRHDPSEHGGGWFLELAWVERTSGRPGVDSARASMPEDLPKLVRAEAPRLIAGVLQRPWPPPGERRTRRRFALGGSSVTLPGARIKEPTPGQVYKWNDTIRLAGVQASLSPWERGAWAVETSLAVYFPQPMAAGGWETPSNATGEFQGAGTIGVRALRSVRGGGWTVTAGAGGSFHETIASFRSANTETGVVLLWLTPVASLGVRRAFFSRGAFESFVQLELAGHYDALDRGPADWMFQSVASAGVAF